MNDPLPILSGGGVTPPRFPWWWQPSNRFAQLRCPRQREGLGWPSLRWRHRGHAEAGASTKSRKTAQPFERKSNCTKKKGTETTYNLIGLWSVVLVDCPVHVEEFGSPNILSGQFLKFQKSRRVRCVMLQHPTVLGSNHRYGTCSKSKLLGFLSLVIHHILGGSSHVVSGL